MGTTKAVFVAFVTFVVACWDKFRSVSVALTVPAVVARHGRLDETRVTAAGKGQIQRVAHVLNRNSGDSRSPRRSGRGHTAAQVPFDRVTDQGAKGVFIHADVTQN